mmetsp:Transcript_68178/g.168453  ORF Transcript_68178/g.168453 Transcript_68178/m.168453 type:complete len:269 (-) Transcript_68178:423-1229(-)
MAWLLALVLALALVDPTASQGYYDSGMKAVIHEHASAKQSGGGLDTSSLSSDKCCTIAMFLGTMEMPAGGETEVLAQQALSCCREVLCSKFVSQQDCTWISSGDDSWKTDLSNDLDRVESLEKRLQQLAGDDLRDPDSMEEKARLIRERDAIEKREMIQLRKVSPLTTMCDQTLDDALQGEDAESLQEARVDCVTLFVQIAAGSCQWQPTTSQCRSVARPGFGRGDSSIWPTVTVVGLIAGILGITYYVARPAAMAEQDERGEYSSLG